MKATLFAVGLSCSGLIGCASQPIVQQAAPTSEAKPVALVSTADKARSLIAYSRTLEGKIAEQYFGFGQDVGNVIRCHMPKDTVKRVDNLAKNLISEMPDNSEAVKAIDNYILGLKQYSDNLDCYAAGVRLKKIEDYFVEITPLMIGLKTSLAPVHNQLL